MHRQISIISLIRGLLIILCMLMAGCSQLGYLSQAARGQLEITFARTPINEVLAGNEVDSETRKRLRLVQKIRQFAIDELALPENSSYTVYSELGRSHVVWNVVAAPVYDLTLETWCFPIAGCLAYRGYFAENKARAYQQALIKQGFDTDLYGVAAYSTLGWLTDPVLDTFLYYPEPALAGLIFHELAHQVLYVKDDSAFNEAFATAVEQEGVERWMRAQGDAERISIYRTSKDKNNRIIRLILDHRKRLAEAYKNTDADELAIAKRQVLDELTEAYEALSSAGLGSLHWDKWFTEGLNNARLGSIATYHRLVPAFRAALSKAESMQQFYEIAAEQGKRPYAERHAWLNSQTKAPRTND